jgi:hypothetical protein
VKITIVALMCHTMTGINAPVCREEVVLKQDMPMQACVFSQPAIAEWKERTIFRGSNWTVQRIKCAPGDYVLKDAT